MSKHLLFFALILTASFVTPNAHAKENYLKREQEEAVDDIANHTHNTQNLTSLDLDADAIVSDIDSFSNPELLCIFHQIYEHDTTQRRIDESFQNDDAIIGLSRILFSKLKRHLPRLGDLLQDMSL